MNKSCYKDCMKGSSCSVHEYHLPKNLKIIANSEDMKTYEKYTYNKIKINYVLSFKSYW